MPSAAATTETARGTTEAPPRVEEKPEWWASPATLGLMGFGTTTILAGLNDGGWIQFGALLSMAMFFGGIAQLIAGIIAMRKGNMFAGTAFIGYGAFWLAFNWLVTEYVIRAPVLTGAYDVSAFLFVWFLFTLGFLINAPKHGTVLTLIFASLTLAFLLLIVQWWEAGAGTAFSAGTLKIVGGEIVIVGLLAVYLAWADLTNWNWGRKVLPT